MPWRVRVARRAELTAVGWSELAALQVGLFAVQEVAERLADGVPLHDLASRPVLAALLAQLLVAAALVQLIAAAGRTLAEWLEPPARPRRGRSVVLRPSPVPALVPARIGAPPRPSWSSPSLISDDPTHPAHLSEGPRCHSPFGAPDGARRPPSRSLPHSSSPPAGTATTRPPPTTPRPPPPRPTTSATTPTSGDDATTSTTAGDAATGPEEVAAFDGFSVWLDDTGSYLLRLDESWVPQDDGTVTTPGGDGPVRLVVDGTPTRLVMAEWTDLGTLAEGERELTLELLDDQGEPVSDGGTAGTVTVEATDDAPTPTMTPGPSGRSRRR